MYFIFKAIDLSKTKGQLVVIFPSSWLKARSGKSFEKALYSQCSLKQRFIFQEKSLKKRH